MGAISYAEKFLPMLQEKYRLESKSDFLTTPNSQIRFVDAKTIKVPEMKLGGYGSHTRGIGFNTSQLSTSYKAYTLGWDRDVELFVDPMDIDETNQVVSVANIQNTFEEDVAIPERDKYRFSKLYQDVSSKNATAIDSTTKLTTSNILATFDAMMEKMDEAEVKEEGRRLVVTPTVYTMLKKAEGIQRTLEASSAKNINRIVHSLDDVEIIKVPSSRLKSKYADAGEGDEKAYTATSDAVQIHMILVEPGAVIAVDKYAYIKVFTPGSDSRTADGYVYQNRKYGDLFLIEAKKDGVAIVADAPAADPEE
ncbi:capsid protein [Faecalicoccus acidiformans]|uniref:capsid protein n=1 Tax=Faecalicoccus acidiformans TaxID=915173 RepID=UPI0025A402A7|nr:capsid protein [Faecalicoccus acidiformans]MDM8204273.1 capsid protein [Faecalicoccus acidiformans]